MCKKYIIDEEKLRELIKHEATLAALEGGGVDNWDWYGDSIKDMLDEYDASSMEEAVEIDLNDLISNKTIQEYIEQINLEIEVFLSLFKFEFYVLF